MIRLAVSAVAALAVLCQPITFAAFSQAQSPDRPPSEATSEARSPDAATALLDRRNRISALFGLTVTLSDRSKGPLLVHVLCQRRASTPPLAINTANYVAGAHLLNVTSDPEHGCESYQVASVDLSVPPVSVMIAGRDQNRESLAVGINHAGVCS